MTLRHSSIFVALVAVVVAAGWWLLGERPGSSGVTPVAPTFVDEAGCRSCHVEEYQHWSGSHHALAMQSPTEATVLGNFANASFAKDGMQTRFFRRDEKFFVNTQGPEGVAADYEVKYTFGVEPLQQYLLALPGGRLQALTIAWDTERKRWFDLHPDHRAGLQDELHWTRPANNWNFMCADCHSTAVQKNYDRTRDRYQTRFAQINVSCQACHGPASAHLAQMNGAESMASIRSADGQAATLGEAGRTELGFTDPRSELEVCAQCHSLRSQISEQKGHGQALLDAYRPSLPQAPLYFVDGQIKGEVYEYGSFLQSRMHSMGVRCSDCHEPHTLKTRAEGNALCTSCHNDTAPAIRHAIQVSGLKRKNYDSPAHHFHVPGSAGAQCVNCHMPTRTYMQVQQRHDHSLKIPRPDLSVKLGTPNACNQCHVDRTPEWAAQAVARWYGPGRRQELTYGETLWAGSRGEPGASPRLSALADSKSAPAIVRATALDLLRKFPGEGSLRVLSDNLADPDPLLRLTAVQGFERLAPERRVDPLRPMLQDPVRAVRMEAARLLAAIPSAAFDASDAPAMRRALHEYEDAQLYNADRPESHLNLGNLYASQNRLAAAEHAYQDALARDASFTPAYVNLADLKARGGAFGDAERVLRDGLRKVPDAPPLVHALGLILVRQQRFDEALETLRRAVDLAPDEPCYAYVYAVAVHDLKGPAQGVALLQGALKRFPNDRDLLRALAGYARDAGDDAAAAAYVDRLQSLDE